MPKRRSVSAASDPSSLLVCEAPVDQSRPSLAEAELVAPGVVREAVTQQPTEKREAGARDDRNRCGILTERKGECCGKGARARAEGDDGAAMQRLANLTPADADMASNKK